MLVLATVFKVIVLILVVLTIFNIIIFVHELGHFLAAKWRGLRIDRFQIWFGSPIWKFTRNGVQYGLGWIPAGGFVALPQMATMEAIEGTNGDDKPLPPISPLDKIIVAVAGPLFSLLLALLSATVVWKVGKPKDFIPSQVVGMVEENSPASKAVVQNDPTAKTGIQPGDKIVSINGNPVNGFAGSLDSIFENIILSKGSKIHFVVERKGVAQPLELVSEFKTDKNKWYQRSGLRKVGIGPEVDHLVLGAITKNSPAQKAGIKDGDVLVTMDGKPFKEAKAAVDYVKETAGRPIELVLLRKDKQVQLTVTPQVPLSPKDAGPKLGMAFSEAAFVNMNIVHPGPVTQIRETVRTMWMTISRVVAPDSSIGVGHLSGPVGIASVQYELLQMDDGWRRILAFMVLFNVNLAILNMMPFPVLDGGHITLAILEKITGRPVRAKVLEVLQTVCALALMSLMLFVTSKDIGDKFGHGDGPDQKPMVFPE